MPFGIPGGQASYLHVPSGDEALAFCVTGLKEFPCLALQCHLDGTQAGPTLLCTLARSRGSRDHSPVRGSHPGLSVPSSLCRTWTQKMRETVGVVWMEWGYPPLLAATSSLAAQDKGECAVITKRSASPSEKEEGGKENRHFQIERRWVGRGSLKTISLLLNWQRRNRPC